MPEKLVRDNDINRMNNAGVSCKWRFEFNNNKYRGLLDLKFAEEAKELSEAYGTEAEEEEFADVFEVIRAFGEFCDYSFGYVLLRAKTEADQAVVYGQHYADIYRVRLFDRLNEQVRDLPGLPSSILHTWATSVLATTHLMLAHRGIELQTVLDRMEAKNKERGGFCGRFVLITE